MKDLVAVILEIGTPLFLIAAVFWFPLTYATLITVGILSANYWLNYR